MAQKGKILKTIVTYNIAFKLHGESKKRVKSNATNKLNTQKEAVLYFIQKLDSEMVDLLLCENSTFDTEKKLAFILKLSDTFDTLQKEGNTFLNKFIGTCQNTKCNDGCEGYTFIGNKSRKYFDLVFDTKNNIVNNIQECRNLKCCNEQDQSKKFLNQRIYLEPANEFPF